MIMWVNRNQTLDELSVEQIDQEIQARQGAIESLRQGLPYADHGAYGQDLDRIADYSEDIHHLLIVKAARV